LREKAHVMRQVGAGKANVSEPLWKRRKRSGVIETGVQSLPRDEPGGCLLTGQVVTGAEVARARFRHWHGTWEPVAPLVLAGCWTGQPKGVPQAAETARGRVLARGTGADRLVVAVRPVMRAERRRRVARVRLAVNRQAGRSWVSEPKLQDKPFQIAKMAVVEAFQRIGPAWQTGNGPSR
jgi:hypothetical protein